VVSDSDWWTPSECHLPREPEACRRRRGGGVADYEADVTVGAICATHQIGLTRLYRILDRHQVERRRPNAPRLPKRLRQRILADYIAGVDVDKIAHRHGVSHGTVSNIAARHGVLRNPHRNRDELVELVVRWFIGGDTTHEERQTIVRIGVRTRQPGLRSLADLDPAIAADVIRRLLDVLREQCLLGKHPTQQAPTSSPSSMPPPPPPSV
jgi:transposase-like protein